MSESYRSFAERRDSPRKTWTPPTFSGGYRSSADRRRDRQRLFTEDKPESLEDGLGSVPNMGRDMNNDFVSSDGGTIYSKDGKRITTNGVTYDRATSQAINPDTGKISSGGYSIDPKSGNRTDYKPGEERPYTRIPDRSTGVETSPTGKSTAASPMDWAQYEAWLGNKGIQVRGGYESVALPGTKSAQFNGENIDLNSETFRTAQSDFETMAGGQLPAQDAGGYPMGKQSDGGYGGFGGKYRPLGEEQAGGAQEGMSSAPDVGDQSRALRIGVNGTVFGGDDEGSALATRGSAISARSRAFLDAPMGVGPMGVMRRTNAAQGILRNDGKIAIKTGEGEYTEITKEGYDEIRQNHRNATEFKEDFMRKYVPESPADTQSPDSGAPVASSKMEYNTNFGPTVDTESYGQIIDSIKGMKGIGPIADGDVYGMFLDGREPLMRGPKKDEN